MSHYGSMECTYRIVNIVLDKVGLKGNKYNLVVSLRFSITNFFKRSYNQGIME